MEKLLCVLTLRCSKRSTNISCDTGDDAMFFVLVQSVERLFWDVFERRKGSKQSPNNELVSESGRNDGAGASVAHRWVTKALIIAQVRSLPDVFCFGKK